MLGAKAAPTRRGHNLPEVLIAAILVGVFFASIFEVNAICLRYISASKENISGIQCVQDRLEQLRQTGLSDGNLV